MEEQPPLRDAPYTTYYDTTISFDLGWGVSPSIVEGCGAGSQSCHADCPDEWEHAVYRGERIHTGYYVKDFGIQGTWFNPPCEPWTVESVVTDWWSTKSYDGEGFPDVFLVGGLDEARARIAFAAADRPLRSVCEDCGGMPFDVYASWESVDSCGAVEVVQIVGSDRLLVLDIEVYPTCGTAD